MSSSSGGHISGHPSEDGQSRLMPAFLARLRVASASAPTTSTTGRDPELTRSAARLTSHCGMLPPIPEQRVSAFAGAPIRLASSAAGSAWRSESEWTVQQ